MSVIRGNWYDLERCDRCVIARAMTAYVLNTGGVLYMCGHHGRKHATAIEPYLAARYTAPLLEENRAVGAVH